MEAHIFEAMENNVFGTYNVAVAARARVEDFVMISSDKAVRPTNIMGATKRIAELAASGAARKMGTGTKFPNSGNSSQSPIFPGPKYSAVRFRQRAGLERSVIPSSRSRLRRAGR